MRRVAPGTGWLASPESDRLRDDLDHGLSLAAAQEVDIAQRSQARVGHEARLGSSEHDRCSGKRLLDQPGQRDDMGQVPLVGAEADQPGSELLEAALEPARLTVLDARCSRPRLVAALGERGADVAE